MANVRVEISVDGCWQLAARLDFPAPELGTAGTCHLAYDFDYALRNTPFDEGRAIGHTAVSCNHPVGFAGQTLTRWPAFLDDMRPSGAAERTWIDRLDLGRLPEAERAFPLLAQGTPAPIGNLRIAEAVPPRAPPMFFDVHEVIERNADFLEHAAQLGASIGGATGAGGDAPKVLLRQTDDGRVWIDPWQDDARPDAHLLVKFARGARSERDRTVLRSEFVYTRALAALGFQTIDVSAMHLEEAVGLPSLWLPRFDRAMVDGRTERLGMESLYSLIEASPGSYQTHQTYLTALLRAVDLDSVAARVSLVSEYIARDVLSRLFGNSDNHGRNTAVLKGPTGIRLAPIYDFAPMKMDPEMITPTTRWEGHPGSDPDWHAIVTSVSPLADPQAVWAELHRRISPVADLYELLGDLGLPDETLRFPAIGLENTRAKLERWGLA